MTGTSDAIEAGRLLSANKVLIGSVNKFGEDLLLTARVVDVEQGVTEHAEKAQLDSEEELIHEVNRISKKIVDEVAGRDIQEKSPEEYKAPLENPSSLSEAIMGIVQSALRMINEEMDWDDE